MGRSKRQLDKRAAKDFEGGAFPKPFNFDDNDHASHVPTQRELDQRSIEDFEGPGHFKPW
jgi:hypothetical protein